MTTTRDAPAARAAAAVRMPTGPGPMIATVSPGRDPASSDGSMSDGERFDEHGSLPLQFRR